MNAPFKQEHAPSFPAFVQTNREKVRWDTLAHSYGDGVITTIDGETLYYSNYEELENSMFHVTGGTTEKSGQAILLFLEEPIASWHMFDECIAKAGENRCEILATGDNEPTCIKIKSRNNHREVRVSYITTRRNWPCKGLKPADFLTTCQQVFEWCGVGTCSAISTLGMTILRQSFYEAFGDEWKKHKHSRPPLGVIRSLKAIEPQGLVETPGAGREYLNGYAIDGKNMYGSQLTELPTGTAIAIRKEAQFTSAELLEMYQYVIFTSCRCEIVTELAMGVFPFRNDKGIVVQPKEVGCYTGVSMGRDQLRECLAHGVRVTQIEGWAWEKVTDDCTWFVKRMERLRDYAPNDAVKTVIKLAFVATVGVMGMNYFQHTITPQGEYTKNVEVWTGGLAHEFGVTEKANIYTPFMTHWHYKAIDSTRATVTHEAYPFAEDGKLIAIDTDEFLVEKCKEAEHYVMKEDAPYALSGTFLRYQHTNLRNIKPRTYTSDEKDKQPGVPEKFRERRKSA